MAEITCAKCGQRAEALTSPPLVGKRGETIQQNICPSCWKLWVDESVLLINHYGIEVSNPAQRQQLYGVMAEFLNLKEL
jgi:Fe-S cluster biosynthesis and repair protein YggX